MKTKNKLYFWAVGLSIIMLVTSFNAIGITDDNNDTEFKIIRSKVDPSSDSINGQREYAKIKYMPYKENTQITMSPEDEYGPTISIASDGLLASGYTFQEDFFTQYVPWWFSLDDGETWDGGVYLYWDGDLAELYPSIDYFGSDYKFYGTFMDDVNDDGARQYVLTLTDVTDPDSWDGYSITWSSTYPYFNRKAPDIKCYDLGLDYWYGVMLCVGSRDERLNMPIFNYNNYENPDNGWSSYHDAFQGCENSALAIDKTNGYFYGVLDYYNETDGDWDIVMIRGDCHPDEENYLKYFDYTQIGESENTKFPAVGVQNDYLMILAQEETTAGGQDIICYYSSDAGDNFEKSIVVDSADDELYPEIVSYGTSATCTFTKNNNLYISHTLDGGVTWTNPQQVNSEDGSYALDSNNAEIIEGGKVIWADNRDGNLDIFLEDMGYPEIAVIEIGDIIGGFGLTVNVENIGGADATDVPWSINLEGGLMILGGHIEGTIDTLVGDSSTTISSGLILGIGKPTITVTAGDKQKTATATVIGPFVIGLE